MNDLISKKELLETYQISYGALYRWKRMGLIPEEWFIKKSAMTGQETFFERRVICERIETILCLKDTYSLEEIAEQFRSKKEGGYLKLSWTGGALQIPLSDLGTAVISDGDAVRDITEKLKQIIVESMDAENASERIEYDDGK